MRFTGLDEIQEGGARKSKAFLEGTHFLVEPPEEGISYRLAVHQQQSAEDERNYEFIPERQTSDNFQTPQKRLSQSNVQSSAKNKAKLQKEMSSRSKAKFGVSAFKDANFKHTSSKLMLNYGMDIQNSANQSQNDASIKKEEIVLQTPDRKSKPTDSKTAIPTSTDPPRFTSHVASKSEIKSNIDERSPETNFKSGPRLSTYL
mmetsp:Transcript_17301/g.26697  ORF Transcript_17301/g.26697 Transcript_17301/m.26697 type:complete len:203 (+) Transcript_17301:40-648(+)